MSSKIDSFIVEDGELMGGPYRNFSGREGMYNREGDRSFCLILDPVTADTLAADGWRVKIREGREEGDQPTAYISIKVKYGNRSPNVVMITSEGRTHLDESNVEILDWADIQKVDVMCRAYHWEHNGDTGISAYLKSLYVTIDEDPLERKYNSYELEAD